MPETAVAMKRVTPESMGIASRDILKFVQAAEADGHELHSLMVLKDGNVVAEGWWAPYRAQDVHLLYSLSKSFTSTAIGFAVQEGLLGLDDRVISFFSAETPANVSENLRAMKVRHLLSMSAGQAEDDLAALRSRDDGDWARGFLEREVPYEPGAKFLYNSAATYMLSAIVTRVSGDTVLDYLRPRLLDPLGIEDAIWETCPKGVNSGGWGLSITTESIARFGQFYLQRGVWDGKRLLSEAWIADATRSHVSNGDDPNSDWQQGYGFQFWRCRHNCFRGDGAFGQFCVVLPHRGMVVAITASVSDLQGVLDLVWTHLLGSGADRPIAAGAESAAALRAKLAELVLPGPGGDTLSPVGVKASGRIYRRISGSEDMQTIVYDFDKEGCTVTIRNDQGDRSIRAGRRGWAPGVTSIHGSVGQRIASIGRWTSADTYEIKVRYTESPTGLRIVSRFHGDDVDMKVLVTSSFWPTDGPTLQGRAAR